MSVTYTWSIPDNGLFVTTVNEQANVIISTNYIVSANDGANTTIFNGIVDIPYDANTSFIAFSDVTENDVITWVQNRVGNQRIEQIQIMLANRLERQKNPIARPQQTTTPWSTNNT